MYKLRIMTGIIFSLVVVLILAGCGGSATTPTTPTTPTTSSPTPTTPTTPTIPMTTYEDTEHGFSVKYPEGWTKNERELGMQFTLEFKDPEELLTEEVWVEYKAEESTLINYATELKEYLEIIPQFEILSEGDITIGEGISGYEIVGKGELQTGKVGNFRYVVLVREKQAFGVGVAGDPSTFDQQEQLIDNIVNSFKLLPTYTYVPPTPSAGGTYTSDEYGFSITYPEGWIEAPPTGRPGEVISLASVEGLPSISVSVSSVGEGTTITDLGQQMSQGMSQRWDDYELIYEGEITLDDGTPAYEIVFSGTMEGYSLKCKYAIVIQGTQAFTVMGFTSPGRFEQDEAIIDEVIHSFHPE